MVYRVVKSIAKTKMQNRCRKMINWLIKRIVKAKLRKGVGKVINMLIKSTMVGKGEVPDGREVINGLIEVISKSNAS